MTENKRLSDRITELERNTKSKTHYLGNSAIINMVRRKGETDNQWEERILGPQHKGDRLQIRCVIRMLIQKGESEFKFQKRVEQFRKDHPYHIIYFT